MLSIEICKKYEVMQICRREEEKVATFVVEVAV